MVIENTQVLDNPHNLDTRVEAFLKQEALYKGKEGEPVVRSARVIQATKKPVTALATTLVVPVAN